MNDFASGKIQVLSNVDLISEGFDVPNVECVIQLRPTKSLGLYLQQIGRCLRPVPGKTALILDHCGNTLLHGMADEIRQWTLSGSKKRQTERPSQASVKQCSRCFKISTSTTRTCGNCGFSFSVAEREMPVAQSGDLAKLDPVILLDYKERRKLEVKNAKTREALEAIAHNRGYKPGWVDHVLYERKQRYG